MDASCTQVKKLRPYGTEDFKIFVRIERLWEVSQLGKSTQPSLSMILIDKEGDPIHAVVPAAHFDAYKNQLREKQVITLSNFLVESKDKNYCPLNKLFKIKFAPNTHIEEGNPDEAFPNQKFTLTDFKDLPTRVGQTAQLLDIAGLLIRVEKKGTTLKTRAGDSPKQDLFLRNERGDEVRIAFWGKSRELLLPLFGAPEQDTVVIVTSLIAKQYTDDIYLQATYGTRIYVDFEFPQATALKNSPRKPATNRRYIEEDQTIADIILLSKESKEALKLNCVATISTVYIDDDFYYDACTSCKAGVRPDHDSYWCFPCKKLIDKPKMRLRIKFQISDDSGAKDVTVFEEVAQQLVGKSLDELINISLEYGGDITIKEIMEEILGRKLKFEIRLGDFNFQHPDLPFTVSKFFEWGEPANKRIKLEDD